jgi:hypothetical protein
VIAEFSCEIRHVDGKAIRWEDDPEEWARSLPDSCRSASLLAEIAHDDHPSRWEIDQQAPAERRLFIRRGDNRDSENV